MRTEFHYEAYELYRQGKSFAEIAEYAKVSERTVKTWSSKESWKLKALKENKALEQIAFEERAAVQREIIRETAAGICGYAKLVNEAVRHFKKEGALPVKWNEDHFKTLAFVVDKNVSAFRKLFPEVDKEMLEKLIEELRGKENGNAKA